MKKSYFHQIQIFVFFVCSFAVFGFFQFLSGQVEKRDVAEYLISLHSEKQVGCLSFYERQNDILVLGDSHSYTAIDFYKLSQLTGTTKISSCTLGGLYFDSLVKLVEKIPNFDSVPTNIIFGLSLRQFTTGADRESQLKEHSKLIDAMGPSIQSVFLKIKKNIETLAKELVMRTTLKAQRQADLDYWTSVLSELDASKVDYVFDRLHHVAKENWQKYMLQLKFLESNEANIKRFCGIIQKNNINLLLVDLPESPHLQKMYKPKDLQTYAEIVEKLSVCAKKIVRLNHQEWDIDGRYFLNRNLSRIWDFTELYRDLDLTPADRKVLAFDLDHPNLIGAQIITDKMYQQIKSELKYAF